MTIPSLQAEFAKAVDFYRRGRPAEAGQICVAILMSEPLHFDANLMLAMTMLQRGQFDACEKQANRAIAINPNVAMAHSSRGVALAQLGRLDEALQSFDRAIALKPDFAEAFANRGNVLVLLQRRDKALASYDRAILLKPNDPPTYNSRGKLLHELGRPEEALAAFDKAIALKPDFADAFYNRALALQHLGRLEDALQSYDRAIAVKPDFASALGNRGNILQDLGRYDAAVASYEGAITGDPDFAEAFYNRGIALMNLKRPEEALASYERALALGPDYAEARFSRGLCLLAMGNLREGFADHENRWRLERFATPRPLKSVPDWSGENLNGRSILVYSERGFGDIIQFCRYLPLLAEQGAKVGFLVPQKLHRILAGISQDVRFLSSVDGVVGFDVQCALTSLPHRVGTDIATIPAATPYLAADPKLAGEWRAKLGPHGFKIGISWHGASWQGGRAILGRSIPLREFEPLSQIPGVRLISLQKNDGVDQLAALPENMNVETLDDAFDAGPDAFADTAAVMQHLDLVISCDTSVAHLAGALGRPVWVALQYVPEWRWMLGRTDSPWYPTMRLFRQPAPGQWGPVFREIASQLNL